MEHLSPAALRLYQVLADSKSKIMHLSDPDNGGISIHVDNKHLESDDINYQNAIDELVKEQVIEPVTITSYRLI